MHGFTAVHEVLGALEYVECVLTASYHQWEKRVYLSTGSYKRCVNRAQMHGKVDVHGN